MSRKMMVEVREWKKTKWAKVHQVCKPNNGMSWLGPVRKWLRRSPGPCWELVASVTPRISMPKWNGDKWQHMETQGRKDSVKSLSFQGSRQGNWKSKCNQMEDQTPILSSKQSVPPSQPQAWNTPWGKGKGIEKTLKLTDFKKSMCLAVRWKWKFELKIRFLYRKMKLQFLQYLALEILPHSSEVWKDWADSQVQGGGRGERIRDIRSQERCNSVNRRPLSDAHRN
jgi:hypothetical protein